MDAQTLNVIRWRQLLGLPIPTDLPVPLPISPPATKPFTTSGSASLSSTTGSSSAGLSSTSPTSTSSTSTLSSSDSSGISAIATSPSFSSSSSTVLSTTTHTVTTLPSVPSTSASETVNLPNTSFLQNKVLSGIVFTIVGIIGLTILVMIATFALRRRRNKKLLEEAVCFNPVNLDMNYSSLENGQFTKTKPRTSTSTGLGSDWSHGPDSEVRNASALDSPSLSFYDMAKLQAPRNFHSSTLQQAPVRQNNTFRLSPVEETERSRRSRSTSSTEIKFAPSAVPYKEAGY